MNPDKQTLNDTMTMLTYILTKKDGKFPFFFALPLFLMALSVQYYMKRSLTN